MSVRPYEDRDRQGVIDLWNCVFPDNPPWNAPAQNIDRKLPVQRELFFVACDGDAVIGSAMAGYDGHRGWVYFVAVMPQQRKQGIGAALMAAVEQGLLQVGCDKLNLQIRAGNEEVKAFYQSLGYDVEERISMGKRLRG